MAKPYKKKLQIQLPRKNHQIRAQEVRVIDEKKENLGVMPLEKAIDLAKEKELDLIEISPKAQPPVTRIMDWGKYLYQLDKEKQRSKKKQTPTNVVKGVRIGMTTSGHDIEIKGKTVDKFLKKGYKVRIELIMKGREKAMKEVASQKIEEFLGAISEKYTQEQEPKKYPRGMQFVIRPK